MRKGAYVLIFLVWAFITIITPTLVQLSFAAADQAAAQAQVQAKAQVQARAKATAQAVQDKPSDEEGTTVKQYRRMLVMIDGINKRKVPLADPALPPASSYGPPPATSPAQPSDQETE